MLSYDCLGVHNGRLLTCSGGYSRILKISVDSYYGKRYLLPLFNGVSSKRICLLSDFTYPSGGGFCRLAGGYLGVEARPRTPVTIFIQYVPMLVFIFQNLPDIATNGYFKQHNCLSEVKLL